MGDDACSVLGMVAGKHRVKAQYVKLLLFLAVGNRLKMISSSLVYMARISNSFICFSHWYISGARSCVWGQN